MRRSLVVPLVAFLAVVLLATGGTVAAGWKPQLGLDLQGGASVVLQPRNQVEPEILEQAISIIRSRVDALGVAEPEITRQGEAIIVALPGVQDTEKALAVVGQTAQLLFRPVTSDLPREPPADASTTTTAPPAEGVPAPDQPDLNTTTAPEDDDPAKSVVLPEKDDDGKVVARYLLAPAEVKGSAISKASATLSPADGEWAVDFELTSEGAAQWDAMAAKVGQGNRIAIDLDGVVKSAPALSSTSFGGSGQITGNFSETEAKDLALVLRYGSLPVQLDRQTVQTVSASLGQDSLRAGLLAGLLGLGLVALYMVVYYRALGVVVWLGLTLSGALMYSIVSFLGERYGLALTLAGAVGIIVSVGVTVDSYVVYFERLKDEVRAGRTIRSSVDRGFKRAYRTILAADAASFIGAMVLYLLSVGSVRGFALFLALSTALDVIVAYTFTRPLVILLGRSAAFTGSSRLGVARGLAAPAVTVKPTALFANGGPARSTKAGGDRS